MDRQIVVVVHGVGVREAGVSTDQVTACLHSGGGRRWRSHSSDDVHLPELARYGNGRLFPTFRAHLRRFRLYAPGGAKVARERVVADFYWGDVSGTGQDLLRMVSGFLRVVLGLSHVVRENARSCYPHADRQDALLRRLAEWAVLAIHGPIVALNLVILAGLALGALARHLAPAAPWLPAPEALAGWLLGLGSVAAGLVMLHRANVYLLRLLAEWLVWCGLLVLALCALGLASDSLPEGPVAGLHALLAAEACRMAAETQPCLSDYAGIERLGLWLMVAMMLAWAVVVALAWAGAALGRWRGVRPGDPGAVNLVLPAISLMTLLWFLTMSAVWYAVMQLPFGLVQNTDHVLSALRLVVPAVVAFLALAVVGGLIHLRKGAAAADMDPASYLAARDTRAERHRLIVARPLLWVLRLFLVSVTLLPLAGLAGLPELPHSAVGWALALVGLLGVALTGMARGAFAMGVGIVADVVVYLNDYSWSSAGPAPAHARTPLERLFGLRAAAPTDAAPHGYWLRRRIGDRLEQLMNRLIRHEKPVSIVVMSHSQGTVIAMDAISRHGGNWRGATGAPVTLSLVTMGSPYTHVYNSYFPLAFPPPAQRGDLRPLMQGGLLDGWTNIFRTDDFVGTHIDTTRQQGAPDAGTGWPVEQPVRPGGHTHYWTDRKVIPKLRAALDF